MTNPDKVFAIVILTFAALLLLLAAPGVEHALAAMGTAGAVY